MSLELLQNGLPNNSSNKYWIELTQPRLLQIVQIEHSATTVMTICEVLLYDTGKAIIADLTHMHVLICWYIDYILTSNTMYFFYRNILYTFDVLNLVLVYVTHT